jgi:periplasmic protein TonB
MNPSPTYAHRAHQPKSYLGIGLVVALHLAGIYALSAGLIKTPPRASEITTLKPLPPEVMRDPPPPEPIRPSEPTLRNPERVLVPMPIITIAPGQEQPLISTEVATQESGQVISTPGLTQGVAQPQPVTAALVQTAGAVCTVMPRPELPALNWSGEAVLQVLATVRGGRVVGSDFRLAQGALDSKTKRSLQRSVESALAGYQCQGDAVFQQDFAFRLD